MAKTRLNENLRYKIRNKVVPSIVVEEEAAEQRAFEVMRKRADDFIRTSGPSVEETVVLGGWGCMSEVTEFGRYAIPADRSTGILRGDEAIDAVVRRTNVVTVYANPRNMRLVLGRIRPDDTRDGREGRNNPFYIPRGWAPSLPDRLVESLVAYYKAMRATNEAMLTARRAFTSVLDKARTIEDLAALFPPCAELVEEFKRKPPAPVDASVLARCKVARCKVAKPAVDADGDDA